MEINYTREDTILTAGLQGRIDGANALEFESSLKDAVKKGDSTLVIDCSELSYISSAGLRVILLVAKSLRKDDVKFALYALSDAIFEVFQVSGFDQIIPVHPTREAALSELAG